MKYTKVQRHRLKSHDSGNDRHSKGASYLRKLTRLAESTIQRKQPRRKLT